MSDNTSYWYHYVGEYEKQFYDIETSSGEIIERCWPNDGDFFATKQERHIPEEQVSKIRVSSLQ